MINDPGLFVPKKHIKSIIYEPYSCRFIFCLVVLVKLEILYLINNNYKYNISSQE